MRDIFAAESALFGTARGPAILGLVALMTMLFFGLQVAGPAHAETTFTVNSTSDPGTGGCDATECTLREAITAANNSAGADTIAFDIPSSECDATSHVCTISPTSTLPTITEAVIIEGYTQGKSTTSTTSDDATENTFIHAQAGTNAALKIEINGASAGTGSNINGLTISGSSVVVRGLVINRFEDAGIALVSQSPGTSVSANIEGNFIGTNPAGDADLGNGGDGIEVNSSTIGYIGFRDDSMLFVKQVAARNLISGNGGDGI
jgi:CSLREA domain-containing protein